MLKQRLISAAIMLVIVIGALVYLSPYLLTLAVIAILSLAMWEWTQLAGYIVSRTRLLITLVFTLFLFIVSFCFRDQINNHTLFDLSIQPLFYIAMCWWLLVLYLVVTYPKSNTLWGHGKWSNPLRILFGLVLLVPFGSALLTLRFYNYSVNPNEGLLLLFFVLLLIWSTDSGAYFVGKSFGRHKLAPNVSPGKTWQGVIGGLLSALLLTQFYLWFIPSSSLHQLTYWQVILLSLGTASISILGDLAESMFKRQVGVKDSSHLIPGHGGILDRIDSLTAALPFFALIFISLTV